MEGRGGSGGRGGLPSADSGTTVELEGWSAILKAVQKSGDRGSNTTCKLAAAHRASQAAQTRGNIAASSGQARAALEKRGACSFLPHSFLVKPCYYSRNYSGIMGASLVCVHAHVCVYVSACMCACMCTCAYMHDMCVCVCACGTCICVCACARVACESNVTRYTQLRGIVLEKCTCKLRPHPPSNDKGAWLSALRPHPPSTGVVQSLTISHELHIHVG